MRDWVCPEPTWDLGISYYDDYLLIKHKQTKEIGLTNTFESDMLLSIL